jgi:RecB family exonuclease
VLGLPPRWTDEDGEGDLLFSERERALLSADFPIRSGAIRRTERIAVLRAWLGKAQAAHFLDAEYDPSGKEREGISPVLAELFPQEPLPQEPEAKRGHRRWLSSFGARALFPDFQARLPALQEGTEVSATTLDAYSRCEFLGVAQGRWKLRDLREADLEMWGSAFGNLLHALVRRLVQGEPMEQALDEAWKECPPQGMIRSRRLEAVARARARRVAERFWEMEQEFRQRAGTRTLSLEGPKLEFDLAGLRVRGTPDRVEEVAEQGLFIIDYKTATQNFGAREMVEQSYGLQLPLYALGLRKQLGREVLGAQFVELTRAGARSRGLLFKQFNGKEPGKLTNSRAYASLRPETPSELWPRLKAQAEQVAARYREGSAAVRPKRPERDCASCVQYDTCGRRRWDASGLSVGEGESE